MSSLKMKKLDSIHQVGEAEIALIRRQSALLLQRRQDGFNGELKTAGSIVENYVKGLLQKHLPHGYRICSGYIATVDTIHNSDNLIQHDIIIVDDRVPPLYKFGVADIEVVSAEAVCGVIEVKRTLTKESLAVAIQSLRTTKLILDSYDNGVKSKDKAANNMAGPTLSVASNAPIYTVIGLDALKEIAEKEFFEATVKPAVLEFLDMIWSPSAPFITVLQWKAQDGGERCVALHTSRNVDNYYPAYGVEYNFEEADSGRIYRIAICNLRTWINNTSGAGMTPAKNLRYFNLMT